MSLAIQFIEEVSIRASFARQRLARMTERLNAGEPLEEIGIEWGIGIPHVKRIFKGAGVPLPKKAGVRAITPGQIGRALRDAKMVELYQGGAVLEEIGRDYGVTRERVRQILKKAGIDKFSGGMTIRTLLKCEDKRERNAKHYAESERAHFKRYGMSREAMDALSPLKRTHSCHPVFVWRGWRRNVKYTGYRCELKFNEWWRIWEESGKWEQRGRGFGYCMARWDSKGPWTRDNIRVIPGDERSRDSFIQTPSSERRRKAAATMAAKRA